MHRGSIVGGLILLATALAASPARASVLPGEIVVRFRADAPVADRLRSHGAPDPGVLKVRSTFVNGAAVAPDARPVVASIRAGLRRTLTMELAPGVDAEAAAREWATRPDVEFAAPIRLLPLLARYTPNDPLLSGQWHHEAVGSREAWAVTSGDSSVVIAIVDTGIDLEHPDLAPNLWVNRAEAEGLPGVDDDGNGYIDDRNGYDFTDVPEVLGAGDYRDRDPDPDDDIGHGTWVAGMAAAAGDNGVDGAGVAFNCRLMPLRAGFLPRSGFALGFLAEDDAAAAILYAADNGADVINLSFGDVLRAPILEEAVRYAVEMGVVVVAASGNNGDDVPFYPASLAGVLAVGASTVTGARATFSTSGPAVRLLAPGSQVLTTERGGGLEPRSGTSLAAPVVAGAAALLVSRHGDWSAARIIETLIGTSAPVSSGTGRGAGLLKLDRAIEAGGDVVVAFHGLDDGAAVAETLDIEGTATGGAVRGWRVRVRPESGDDWRTLAASSSGQASAQLLVRWPVRDEAEGTWIVRLEALGLDRIEGVREARVSIDRTPPVVSDLEVLPILSETGYGVRAAARTDEPVFGRLTVRRLGDPSTDPDREFDTITATTRPIVGLDAPLQSGDWTVDLEFRDRAGNVASVRDTLEIRDVGVYRQPHSPLAPSAATWLPRFVDLDGDGRLELVGESWDRDGGFYGRVRAWRPHPLFEGECGQIPGFFFVPWTGPEAFIPRDFGDFDGDGRGELLGQGLQTIRVLGSSAPLQYPNQLVASSTEAWASRFVPAAGGTGLDIVASRDSDVRIYRRGGAGLELAERLVNPSSGLNAISPAIEILRTPGGGIGLATIDSDGDLLVAERVAADFEWTYTARRWAPGAAVAAADVDGDGVSELAILEAVGEFPSPAVGLRDGYFRLTLLERRTAGEWAPREVLGVAGHFPGNPMHVQGVPSREGVREHVWVGAGGRMWKLVLDDQVGGLRPVRVVEGVGDGPVAWGLVSPDGVREFTVFPSGPGASEAPGELCFGPMLVEASPPGESSSAIRDLRARVVDAGGGTGIELRWSAPPGLAFRIMRWPVEDLLKFEILTVNHEALSFVDLTAESGRRYVYAVEGAEPVGVDGARIEVLIRPRNPVVSATVEAGLLRVEWTHPVRIGEAVAIDLEDGTRFEAVQLLAGGRRLVASPRPGSDLPVGTARLRIRGLVSDTGLDLVGPDAEFDIELASAVRPLRLVRAWAVTARTIRVELDPGVPLTAVPLRFDLVRAGDPTGEDLVAGTVLDPLRQELDVPTDLKAGDYRVRLRGTGADSSVASEVPLRIGPVVFPNPVRSGAAVAQFQWLAAGDHVRIYDLAGREVWSGEANGEGTLEWPLTGADGRTAAPGIYLFRVTGTWEASGKLAVVK